jgi:hypothetical protein
VTSAEAAEVVTYLVNAYPKTSMSAEQMDVMADAIEDLDYDPMMKAAKRHVRTSRFFPTIAELREAADPYFGVPAWMRPRG